jgi:exodeoxyribonuclease VII small subunit
LPNEKDPHDRPNPPNFEEALAQLETIVHVLEDGQIGLAEALGRYEEGVKLLKECYGLLERTERRIEILCGVDAQGNPLAEPFDDTASLSLHDKTGSRGRRRSAKTPAQNAPVRSQDLPAEMDEPGSLF